MSCNRMGCDNIMCDTYVYNVGYVCKECQKEFKVYVKTHNVDAYTEGKIKKELQAFMETEKDYFIEGKEMDVDQFFDENTRD